MIHINNIVYRIGGRTLFEGASARVVRGQRTALVGQNGTGKSTLIGLIAGDADVEAGDITIRNGTHIGQLAQEPPSGSESALDTVLAADVERTALMEAAEKTSEGLKLAEIHTRLADIDAHSAPARAASILAGLGFDEAAQAKVVDEFSGGWRMRIALAALLFSAPDLLLLDEPTNHLDLEAVMWLESFLSTYSGTLLLVSHDRAILNRVPQVILHLDGGQLVSYSGTYDKFEATRLARIEQSRKLHSRDQARRKHMQAMVDRFRYKASKARQAQSRIKALARMKPVAAITEEQTPPIHFPEPSVLASPIMSIDGAAVGYGDTTILSNLNLRIDADDRIGLLGANGNGKTTFARLLAGEIPLQAGSFASGKKAKVGYFAQEMTDTFTVSENALWHLGKRMPRATPEKLRSHLGSFGLIQQKAELPVGELSGGERSRLSLALIAADAPALLILDEPTNHLDIDSRGALVEALNDFLGAIILISHDRQILELCTDRLWRVANGGVSPFNGDLDAYEALTRQERGETRTNGKKEVRSKASKRRASAESRAAEAENRKRIRSHETKIERLANERDSIDAELALPEIYEDADKLTVLTRKRSNIEAEIKSIENDWLALTATIEENERPN